MEIRRIGRRLSAAAALLATAALLAAPAASAHAFLIRSAPAAGATLAKAPARLLLVFSEPVAPAGIEVVPEAGGPPVGGRPFVPHGAPNEIVVPLRPGVPPGGYVVRWREVDEVDGHVISGSVAFAVGAGERAPAVHASRGSDFQGWAAVARWLLVAGLLLGAGVAGFRRLVWLPAVRAGHVDREAARRERTAAAVALAGSIAVAAAGAGMLLSLQPEPLATRFGKLVLLGGAGAAAAAALAAASLRVPRLLPVAEIAAILLLAIPTVSGHASAPGPAHLLSVPSDLAHLAAAAAWTGCVFCLLVVAPFAMRRAAPAWLTRRAAPVAAGSVVVLAATGAARAVGELEGVSQIWTTSYGRALIVKTALLAVLVAIAALSRGRPRRPVLVLELCVLALVVAAVAVLTSLRPGRDVAPAATLPPAASPLVVAAQADDLAVGLALTPRGGSSVAARATVLGPNGPASGLAVRLRLSGRWVAARPCGRGCYAAAVDLRGAPGTPAIRLARPGRKPVLARFRAPASWPAPAAASIVRRATQTFRSLRTLTIVSRLASSATDGSTSLWKLQAPDRLSYRELGGGGAAGVIVGKRRWDRDARNAPWDASPQEPIRQPAPPWPAAFRSAHLLGSGVVGGRSVWIVSFVDPTTPSWFTVAVDKTTYRTLWVDMIAAAHFMHERYLGFDAPLAIVPPRR